eukprot:GHRR01000476.1.p1 GENE.GHRR01000476.1~~GHRR01000476.1.p1  ORF type:complete len:402 (+),score=52.39 GHRR01000476.1:347-1552(+)
MWHSQGLGQHRRRKKLARQYDWSIRGIRWLDVMRYQHFGGVLLFIPAVVIIAIAHWTFQDSPVTRQALVYDASISYPLMESQSIPNNLAVIFNWLGLLIALLVVELVIYYKQHSLTFAITCILHHLWSCLIIFLIVVALTEITKPFSGRLRPDFLSRCHPAAQGIVGPGTNYTEVLGPNAAPLGPLHLGQTIDDCTNPNKDEINDGRLSFPSGHSSNSMSVAWYTAFYIMWSLYVRSDAPYPSRLYEAKTICGRVVQEILYAAAYGWVLLVLCLSWFIGMTRFWDNVHNISDIIGGFLLAIIFTAPYIIKAIGLQIAIRDHIDGNMDQDTTVLAPAGSSGMLPVINPAGTATTGAPPVSSAAAGYNGPTFGPQDGLNSTRNGPQGTGSNGDVVLQLGRADR